MSQATVSSVVTPARRAGAARSPRRPSPLLFWGLLGFLALEYLRPPMLQPLRLQLLFILAVPVLWLTSRERPWSRNLTLQAAFLVAGTLMLPFAHNYFSVYMITRFLFGYMVLSLAITWLLPDRQRLRLTLWTWVAILCFQAAWGVTHAGRGYGGFMHDENDLAVGCVIAFPFAYFGFQWLRGWQRWVSAAAAVLLVGAVVASFSRGGFIGLAGAALYCVLMGRYRLRNLAIGCVGALAFYVAIPSEYKEELLTIQDVRTGTAETRLFLWTAAVNMWRDSPILGVGPGNSFWLLAEYQPEPTESGLFSAKEFTDRRWGMRALHSVYFQLLANHGLVGCAIFAWIGVAHFRSLRALRRERGLRRSPPGLARDAQLYALGLEGAMAGFLSAGAFLSILTYPYFWNLGAFGVALTRAIRRELPRDGSREPPTGRAGAPASARTIASGKLRRA